MSGERRRCCDDRDTDAWSRCLINTFRSRRRGTLREAVCETAHVFHLTNTHTPAKKRNEMEKKQQAPLCNFLFLFCCCVCVFCSFHPFGKCQAIVYIYFRLEVVDMLKRRHVLATYINKNYLQEIS